MFRHFVVSHFNVKWKWRKGHRVTKQTPDINWFNFRIKIFKDYTYPSIINQANKNFKWIIFFDGESTDKSQLNGLDGIIPIFMDKYKLWNYRHVINSINSNLDDIPEYIITSKIDVDDMYHPDMIDNVQSLFEPKKKIIDFNTGLFYNIFTNEVTKHKYEKYLSPFFSMIEPYNSFNMKTCFVCDHAAVARKMKKTFEIQRIDNESPFRPKWLTTIHGENTVLKMRGQPISSKYLCQFGVDSE